MMTHDADLYSVLIKCIRLFKEYATTEEKNDMVEELASWLFNVHMHYNVHSVHGNARLVSLFKDYFNGWDDE